MLKRDVKIICVLKKSSIYSVDYVLKLQEQAEAYAPGVPFFTISDTPVPGRHIPIRHNWPGWWSKLELFRPEITGDLFFLDLDTIICDEIWDLLNVGDLTMLRDFYRPEGLGSGLMYLPESARGDVWKHFIKHPGAVITRYRRGGDQSYLEMCFGKKPLRWQDEFPNRVVSYKAHNISSTGVKQGTGIVCFHGKPKPRDIQWKVKGLPPLPRKEE